MSGWPAGEHLAEVYDALYFALGRGAPLVGDDAIVVRLHEASRTFGALALEVRGPEVVRDPLVETVVDRSLAQDPTGALTLYALAMVIGPRLLVTLRDYLDVEADEERRRVLTHGSDLVVDEIRAVGRTVPTGVDRADPAWGVAARELVDVLDQAGYAESLGQRV